MYEDIKSWEMKEGNELIEKYIVLAYNRYEDIVKIYPCDTLKQAQQIKEYLRHVDLEIDENGDRDWDAVGRYSKVEMYIQIEEKEDD